MLIDSNIIIIASKLLNVKLIEKLRSQEQALRVSVVTHIEVLGYHQLKATEKIFLENFFRAIPIILLDEAVAQRAIELRQKRIITLADSVIAATALVHNLALLTENTKDYARIPGLRLISIQEFVGD